MKNFIASCVVSVAVIALAAPVGVGAAADSSDLILQLQQDIMSLQMQINSLVQQGSQGLASPAPGEVLGAVTFADGDDIKTVSRLKVRATPSTSGAVLGTAPKNATGVIRCDLAGSTACPTDANGYHWWYVKWDSTSIPSGWSADAYFAPVSAATTPVIQAISPTFGTPGFPVTISGGNFTPTGNSVMFGTTAVSDLPSYNGTTLQTTVPAGMAPGSVKVSVANANGASNQVSFKVTAPAPPPVEVILSSIEPNDADQFWLNTNPITLRGSGFTSGGNTVRFSGSYTFGAVKGTPTSITFTMGTPTGTSVDDIPYDCWGAGTFSVMVKNANGTSNALPFSIGENPACVNPVPANPSSVASKGHLSGQVISTDPANSTLVLDVTSSSRISGVSGTVTLSPGAYTIQVTPSTRLVNESGNAISLGQVLVGVRANADGYMTSAGSSSRTINASQTTIQFGSTPISPPGGQKPPTTANVGFTGAVVSVDTVNNSFQGTVTSVYSISSQLAAALFIQGGIVNVIVPANATLTDGCGNRVALAQVPANAGFDANVSVNLVTNVIMAKTIRFNIGTCNPAFPPPYIGSMVPSSGPVGSPVTISGSGFTSVNNTVNFGGIAISNVGTLNNDPKSIRFTVPAAAPTGATVVTVSNVNGTSNTATFTVSAPGEINVLAPNGGETLTAGTNYKITWNASASIASVDINLYKAGSLTATIASAVPASQGYYIWTVPQSTASGSDYTITISSGSMSDASNAPFTITSQSQSLNAFLSNIVLFGSSVPKGTVNVAGTINGNPLTGALTVDFAGPSGSQADMPVIFATRNRMKTGDYTFTYKSGGPAGATFQGIKVNAVNAGRTATQTLAEGGVITFTFVFTSP
ncbi:MAG: hypothetical protein A3A44_01560 [Candidatus Sungbacteria bacterium RIFCSPLOWO2_01_FULL_60_25]|uniref:IPT/TIG domain-containing protein n=1 Tax=Candidatus Sungbacteria bacterium RIFCSPLOWO2_01_FULL_60_25 TaxID=1802281 RepID=A0A1G2LEE1_9BACT|nr:MAG: hypothetical protein A3A44_01560 [Candidatus Sungbacteria bacterium RIFCSPLOWO2_01_FULL_60_25]